MRAEGFSCIILDVLYEGLGISKLQFMIKKHLLAAIFVQFLLSKPWIRFDFKPEMLDPNADLINPDSKHFFPDVVLSSGSMSTFL